MDNIGTFIFNISRSILGLGTKLYDVLTQSVNISFIAKILDFFGANVNLPNEISLIWILTGGTATLLLLLIIIKVVL